VGESMKGVASRRRGAVAARLAELEAGWDG
jgi:hypothetical protein